MTATKYVYADLNYTYDVGSDGDIKKDTDLDAIKSSIRNILSTSKGTRRMLPMFGANLDWLLFEPLDTITAKKIGETILEEIFKWEYRVVIDNVHVAMNEDAHQYNISVKYHLAGIGEAGIGTINFILKQS